ncbi:MAG TPA: HemK/PrmC family methyltransferase, partial [Ardenticatenaceae bacterium]|nr:HemK/PrmC family methyltransferase [Ardenticatenaceae bacterium]
MTVGSLLEQAEQRLRGVSETARLDAQLLLGELLSRGRGSLLAYPETIVPAPVAERYWELVSRRATGEPLAYLLGRRDFYGREFVVDRRVLIPRPETELLIERALDLLAGRPTPIILDVGTGSGAIAVTLAAELPGATVIAADVSGEAL